MRHRLGARRPGSRAASGGRSSRKIAGRGVRRSARGRAGGDGSLSATTASKVDGLQRKLELLLAFDLKIASETNPDRLLQLLADETRQILQAERCTVFLYDRHHEELWSKVAHGLDVSTIRFPKDQGLAGHVFTTRQTVNIRDAYADARFSRQFDRQTGYKTKTVLAMPMLDSRHKDVLGVFEVLNKKAGRFETTDKNLLTVLADHAAVAVENAQLYKDLTQAQMETVFCVALMAEHRDLKDIAAHLRRISVYCGLIAEALGWAREDVETLKIVAPLHDVGKVATPDAILLKTGKLTEMELGSVEYRLAWWRETLKLSRAPEARVKEVNQFLEDVRRANRPSSTQMSQDLVERVHMIAAQRFIDRDGEEKPALTAEEVKKLTIKRGNLTEEEREEIQKHTIYGARILAQADSRLMRLAERIAISHHEKYDGTGYPVGLKGEEIPIEARVVAVADVFDALSSKRVYKRGWSLEEVVAYIQGESGKQFDPKVVEGFTRALPRIQQVMKDLIRHPGGDPPESRST